MYSRVQAGLYYSDFYDFLLLLFDGVVPDGPFLGIGFCVLNFLSMLSDFLPWKKLTQKLLAPKAEQFAKLQFLNDKIDQNTNFAKLPSAKWLFLQLFITLLSFWL